MECWKRTAYGNTFARTVSPKGHGRIHSRCCVKFTPEKGVTPYVHGGTELSVGSLCLTVVSGKETKPINLSELEYVLLSDEEVEAFILKLKKCVEESNS